MQRKLALAFTGLLALATILPLVAAWGNDAIQEPSSPRYDTPSLMWQTPNDKTQLNCAGRVCDRLYFNGQLDESFASKNANVFVPFSQAFGVASPTGRLSVPTLVHAVALLGYWRDCNNDGYIGNGATGEKTYPAQASPTPIDVRVCPPGTIWYHSGTCNTLHPNDCLAPNAPYNLVTPMVHEFVDVGNDERYGGTNNADWRVNDPQARVWGDLGEPGKVPPRYYYFRDVLGEPDPQLMFTSGTFDSWAGGIREIDILASGLAGASIKSTLKGIVGFDAEASAASTLDSSALGGGSYPLHVVRYQAYSQGTDSNNWQGNPMVRTWSCSSPSADPTLDPSVNPNGAAGDSVNNTVMGLQIHRTIVNPLTGGTLANVQQNVGPGCNGPGGPGGEVLSDGAKLPHPEDDTKSTSDLKDAVDMFFQYRPPLNEPRNQLAAWGLVPRADRTTGGVYYAHQVFFNDGYDVTRTNYYTFYANVGPAAFAAPILGGVPVTQALPAHVADIGRYGAEFCDGQPTPNPFGWDCNVSHWDAHYDSYWGVKLGQPYDLRDVDCTDFTPVSAPAWQSARDAVDGVAQDTISQPAFEPGCR